MTDLMWAGFWVFMAVVFYVAHLQYMAGHETLFFWHKTDAEKKLRDNAVARCVCNDPQSVHAPNCPAGRKDRSTRKGVIILDAHEIQSGRSRVDWAEGLILQLPEDHDGRNSWLINYGVRKKYIRKETVRLDATPNVPMPAGPLSDD